ncbi:MAG: hypothetical protein LBL66_10930 [Clostridiales bacterium]|jgi:hypothetical protein|nr:hypothetical protein [Clostridiales bacterium]
MQQISIDWADGAQSAEQGKAERQARAKAFLRKQRVKYMGDAVEAADRFEARIIAIARSYPGFAGAFLFEALEFLDAYGTQAEREHAKRLNSSRAIELLTADAMRLILKEAEA